MVESVNSKSPEENKRLEEPEQIEENEPEDIIEESEENEQEEAILDEELKAPIETIDKVIESQDHNEDEAESVIAEEEEAESSNEVTVSNSEESKPPFPNEILDLPPFPSIPTILKKPEIEEEISDNDELNPTSSDETTKDSSTD